MVYTSFSRAPPVNGKKLPLDCLPFARIGRTFSRTAYNPWHGVRRALGIVNVFAQKLLCWVIVKLTNPLERCHHSTIIVNAEFKKSTGALRQNQ